jgi:3'-phosphoadenosine 5'-phosphosulfate sulfotransferase (PAPS reductase)/FAD synthetase
MFVSRSSMVIDSISLSTKPSRRFDVNFDPKNPDPSLHYVCGFSGGKDSVATWLHLTRDLKLPNVTCLFADVGHEFPETHAYLDLLENDHGLPLVRLTPTMRDMKGELKPEKICERLGLDPESDWEDTPLGMEQLAILKRRFPSTTVRFCTTILKLSPSRRWMNENCDFEKTIRVSGVRAQESTARAAKDPCAFDDYIGCTLWMPIHAWTHEEVFDLHAKYGIPPNPLYKEGMGRVGCAPCIMARKSELAAIAERKPEAFEKLAAMEDRVAAAVGKEKMSFFATGKTPERFASHICPNSGKRFPDANDVRLWSLGEPPSYGTLSLVFEEDWKEDASSCQSQYGLCE